MLLPFFLLIYDLLHESIAALILSRIAKLFFHLFERNNLRANQHKQHSHDSAYLARRQAARVRLDMRIEGEPILIESGYIAVITRESFRFGSGQGKIAAIGELFYVCLWNVKRNRRLAIDLSMLRANLRGELHQSP